MSYNLTRIIIIYNSKEIFLDVDPLDEDIYSKLLKSLEKAAEVQNIEKNFKLTTLNSNIPYLLIDESNISSILQEDIKDEYLKILMNKNEVDEEEEDDLFKTGIQRKTNLEDFDEFEREDNQKDDNNEINENNKDEDDKINNNINNNLDNNLDNMENIIVNNNVEENIDSKCDRKEEKEINNNKINEEDNNIYNDLELLNKKSEFKRNEEENEEKMDIIKINNENNIINISKEPKNKNVEKTKENENKNLNISKKSSTNSDIFQNEMCSICEKNLSSIKYICAICEKFLLCEECEKKHHHPCFIYKSEFIQNLKDTYIFITKNYKKSFLSKSKSISSTAYELSLSLIGDSNIYFRPNKKLFVPIKVTNYTNKTLNSSNFLILIKGNKYINLSYKENDEFNILPKTHHIINLLCETPNKLCSEKISLEIYSTKIHFKTKSNLKIDINIEVNEDDDEEKLNNNKLINNNKMIICYNKEHKEMLISLLENELVGKKAIDLIEKLVNNNWDKEKLIEEYNSKDNNEKNINK